MNGGSSISIEDYEGVIIDDPLNIDHMLIKYYLEEIGDAITLYHNKLERNDTATTFNTLSNARKG